MLRCRGQISINSLEHRPYTSAIWLFESSERSDCAPVMTTSSSVDNPSVVNQSGSGWLIQGHFLDVSPTLSSCRTTACRGTTTPIFPHRRDPHSIRYVGLGFRTLLGDFGDGYFGLGQEKT